MWLLAAGWLILVNLLTAAAFALDKRRAERAGRRVPERVLLQLAAAGGSPAALAACQALRHKTRKASFAVRLWLVCAAQGGLLVLGLWLLARRPA